MFEDRRDAGQELAKELERYKGEGVLALAIPRGAVEVGYQVAKHLGADFSLLITRKLPTRISQRPDSAQLLQTGARSSSTERRDGYRMRPSSRWSSSSGRRS